MRKIKTGSRGGLEKTFIVDNETYPWLSAGNWFCQQVRGKHYACFKVYIPKYKSRRVMMHRLIMGEPDNKDVDHINGDTLDNRVENLRVCTRQENLLNSGPKRTGTSGYKWVSWHKQERRWRVIVSRHGKHHWGGSYTSKKAAARAANKIAKRVHGEFAYQNPT